MGKEEFEILVNTLRGKLDETTSALVSEEALAIISAFNNVVDSIEEMTSEMEKLKGEKEELLKVNGKLYQQIGFADEVSAEEEAQEEASEELTIEDVIDEKGELI